VLQVRRMKWLHLERLGSDKLPYLAYKYNPKGHVIQADRLKGGHKSEQTSDQYVKSRARRRIREKAQISQDEHRHIIMTVYKYWENPRFV
jgi:hypothetical protein